MQLSLIIPCYNEEKNLPLIIEKLAPFRASHAEVILVDNGSQDQSPAVLEALLNLLENEFIKSLRIEKNIGYGNGILEGIKVAKGDVIAWTHADMQTDVQDVLGAYRIFCENNKDNIFIKGKRQNRKWSERVFTFLMSMLCSLVLKKRLSDINAQPKMFHKNFLTHLPHPPLDFSLDLYFYYKALVHNYTIIEYPVFFAKRLHGEAKGGGGSSWRVRLKLIVRTWRYIFAMSHEIRKKIR